MDLIDAILVIFGSILAASALIVAKRPDARQTIDKLVPFQAVIGVAMVIAGLIQFLRLLPYLNNNFKENMIQGAAALAMVGTSVVLGALLGMPQILKWVPNPQAQEKAQQVAAQIAPFQVLLGLVGILASLIYLLYRFHITSFN
jgi:heme A synthase